jgi:cellulose synthase/poly-beta-1,6-N-acetylglucosamine synthase-like glycosyltransferase
MTGKPFVSVVVPALNEATDIEGCLRAIAAQEWPLDQLEVVIADALSDDGTVRVATDVARQLGLELVVCENPARRTSAGLNVALAKCAGNFVVRVDARSRIRPQHLPTAVEVLDARPEVGVVGGGQHAHPRSARLIDRAIARALENRYTTGLARYRRAQFAGAADTVWMGAFRRADLDELGGWNEAVALNEDWDLNQRYRDRGFVVWFDPRLDADYLPRQSYGRLARQYFRFGRVKGTWWMRGRRPAPRQIGLLAIPPVGVAAAAVLASYVGVVPVVVGGVALAFAIDAIGGKAPAGPAVRAGAITATVVSCGSWWAGVVAGAAGELAGVQHAHG